MKVSIIICTKNEEGIRTLVPKIDKSGADEIIVIDSYGIFAKMHVQKF